MSEGVEHWVTRHEDGQEKARPKSPGNCNEKGQSCSGKCQVLEDDEKKYPGISQARMKKEVLGIIGGRSLPAFEFITSEKREADYDGIERPVAPVSRYCGIVGQLDVGIRVSP
jgi:hypothetical protein